MPVSAKQSEDKKIPKLRFSGFSGEWAGRRLGDYLDYEQPTKYIVHSTEYSNSYKIPVLTAGKSFILGYTNETDNIFNCKSPVIIFDDFTTASQFVDFPFKVKSSAMKILRAKNEANIKFLFELMQRIRYEIGGHGRHWISKYSNIKVFAPDILEQQKIASFLESLGSWIDNLRAQKTSFESYKKGMMQKIFSQEIRFTDENGNNFTEWEEKRIKDVFEVTRGYVLAVKNMQENPDKEYIYPVYSSQTSNNGLIGFYNKYIYEDAITWTTDGANAGDVNFRKGKFYCTNVCGVLISKEGFANKFIAEILNSVSRKYVSYVGNPKLMNNVMSQIKIVLPAVEEQQKIADFLTSLDNLIESKQHQITQAEIWKKGLMQGLFV